MGADDLLSQNSFHPNQEDEHQNLGSEADQNEQAWQRDQGLEAGADQDLRRSEEAAALSELLLANGVQQGNVDALLQGDTYTDGLTDTSRDLTQELSTPSLHRSLVVIDQSVKDWRELAVSAPSEAEVLVLDQNQDGISQINKYLDDEANQNKNDVQNLAIISEGADGKLLLGNDSLERSNLQDYTDLLSTWQTNLAPGADLLLFGCNVAETEAGKDFIEQLGRITGVDVAASNDLTGSRDKGGDVELEVTTGTIEANIGWVEQGISQLSNVLDAEAIASTSN